MQLIESVKNVRKGNSCTVMHVQLSTQAFLQQLWQNFTENESTQNNCITVGNRTMTEQSSENGAITMPRMMSLWYVRYPATFSWIFTIACCLAVGLGLALRLDLAHFCLVSGYAHVFVNDSIVIECHRHSVNQWFISNIKCTIWITHYYKNEK